MRRAGVVVMLVVVGAFVSGCASKSHTWQAEFTERLEGAAAEVENAAPAFSSQASEEDVFRAGIELGHRLEFKSELIEELNPPAECEEVQEEGRRKVGGLAQETYDVKNLTPTLYRSIRSYLEEHVAELGEVEREAAHCASG